MQSHHLREISQSRRARFCEISHSFGRSHVKTDIPFINHHPNPLTNMKNYRMQAVKYLYTLFLSVCL